MIEGLARCVKNVRRIARRGPVKHSRSRSHLHSAFWSHGASNINLPAWWIFLLQTPLCSEKADAGRQSVRLRKAVSTGLHDIFLDFLYPVQTLALIRRLKRSTTAHHDAAKNVQSYSRTYTSIAQSFIAGRDFGEADKEFVSQPRSRTTGGPQYRINEILDANGDSRFSDELWQKYQDLLEERQLLAPQQLVKMLRYLVQSKRTVDHERAVALFESIPTAERRAIHYSHGVSAALTLKDLKTAINIHREAFLRIRASIGTSSILHCAVHQDAWSDALDVWYVHWENGWAYYTRSDIWKDVEAMPLDHLIAKAASAAAFAISMSESVDDPSTVGARHFALEFIRQVFHRRDSGFDIHQHADLIQKVRDLDSSATDLLSVALHQLLLIDTREHGHRALQLYRELRKVSTFAPDIEIFSNVTHKYYEIGSTSGVLMVFDDWRKCCGPLKIGVYRKIAYVLSMNGDLEALQNLFQDYILEHGKPTTVWFYHYLLQVHYKRADTEGILRCLDHLRADLGFKPGLKAWNFVIATFARVGDLDGAMRYLDELRKQGLRPDFHSYIHLMSMCARRGDRDAVERLYEQSKVEKIPAHLGMINALVQANTNENRLEEAEALVLQASQMGFKAPQTFMWNALLKAYALRKNLDKVSQVHKTMQEANVPSNGITYAVLMTSLTVAKYPDVAWKILADVMPRKKVKRTSMHYAIAMSGYLTTREYGRVFQTYKRMLSAGLNPNMSSQNVLLRAAALVDKEKPLGMTVDVDPEELVRARQTFEHTIANLDPGELATNELRQFVGPNPLDEAFSSTHFEYLIFLYGKEAAFTKVSELYDRYMTQPLPLRKSAHKIEANPSIRLLSALMVTYNHAGDYEEIDRCWNLALDKSRKLARKFDSDTSHEGRVLRSHRFMLNLPLREYIKSLDQQKRTHDLICTVDKLHTAGYALSSANWNQYIQALARSQRAPDHQLAFTLCDRHLMTNWPGWKAFGHVDWFKPNLRAANRAAILRKDQYMPAYSTLVWLARVYLEAKTRGLGGTSRRLEKAGPTTTQAVLNMPRLSDGAQMEILRQEV